MQTFIEFHDRLHKECSYYSRHIGHLKALLENGDWPRVVNGSDTGRVLLMGNVEITNALVMYLCRMMDKNEDANSVHRLSRNLPDVAAIKSFHNERMLAMGISYNLDRHITARDSYVREWREAKKPKHFHRIKQLRDAAIAHNLPRFDAQNAPTYNEVIELAERLCSIVDLAGYIAKSTRGIYQSQIEKAAQETSLLFSILPSLEQLEAESPD
ncbi:MAG: hypothetical protein AAFQ54_05495 [Pseudomonadota bacterium]